jgi:uncharacterized protein YgiM (DUF1202 family)
MLGRVPHRATPVLAATVVTGVVVAVAIASSGASTHVEDAASPKAAQVPAQHSEMIDRGQQSVSRSARRVALKAVPPKAVPPKVKGHQFMTAPLNVWTGPGETSKLLTVLPAGTRVPVTGVVHGHWAQIVRKGEPRWVNNDYLSHSRPTTTAATSGSVLSSAPCASGSSMESGIVSSAITMHRAVCAHFPQVTTYGGYRPDGEHADGHAIDIMVYSDSNLGQQIADWVRANASTLHVDDVIWAQHIWTTQRSSEGWRGMPDRGSTTANHYDHVHVRVF